MTKHEALQQEFKQALDSFEQVLKQEKTDFMRDSAIKRFELIFDLTWKLIKSWLEEKGLSCASPLSCFKEAYRQGLFDYEEIWVEMVKTRNETVHTYDKQLAEKVYDSLPGVLEAIKKLSSKF